VTPAGATPVIGGVSPPAGSFASLEVDRDHAWAAVCPVAEAGLLAHRTGPRPDSFAQPTIAPAASAAVAMSRVVLMHA